MDPAATTCRIKKYPNRRFYDTTRSRHVTLDELYELVRGGQSIQVTDSQTGTDITGLVLTQMILERESPKLDLFPAGLLHQVIQANQNVLHSFVERYFSRALHAFLESQQDFDAFLQRAGLPVTGLATPWQWARSFMGAARPTTPGVSGAAADAAPPASPPPTADAEAIDELRGELAEMSQRLARLQAQHEMAAPTPAPENGSPRKKSKRPRAARRRKA